MINDPRRDAECQPAGHFALNWLPREATRFGVASVHKAAIQTRAFHFQPPFATG